MKKVVRNRHQDRAVQAVGHQLPQGHHNESIAEGLMAALQHAVQIKRVLPIPSLAIASLLGLSACGLLWGPTGFPSISLGDYLSSGARIYFTATSNRGTPIRYRGGPFFGGMMMGRVSCASCHGSDGRGGTHWMHMQVMDAPDIRWSTLSSAEHGEGAGHGDHGEEPPYDEASFVGAVTEGLTPGGERLSGEMPRWQMSDEDARDLIEFLKTLP